MLLHASRSLAAFLIGFVALIFYLFSLAFALMAILKIITPAHVGAWMNGGTLEFGAHYGGPPPGGTELLGYWVIPLTILMALACYLLGTLLLRSGARRMLRRVRPRATSLRQP
jgi:amino acid transporter